MLTYLLKRAFLSIISVFIVITIVFFVMKSLDGLPVSKQLHETDTEFSNRLFALGLTKPLGIQFADYLFGVFNGNYGIYYSNPTLTIQQIVLPVLPYTFVVLGIVYFFSLFFGMLFGIIAAHFRGTWVDNIVNIVVTLLTSIPLFVMMTVFVAILSNAGISSRFYALNSSGFSPEKLVNAIWPILILTIVNTPTYVYFTRNEMADIFNQDYIKVALYKGNSKIKVIIKHGLKNALTAIIYLIVPGFISIISGSVMAETFFGIPGYATLLVSAVQNREYNIVLYQVLIFSSMYYAGNILTDFLITALDPRIRLANESWDSWYSLLKYFFLRKLRLFHLSKFVFKSHYLELQKNLELYQALMADEAFEKNKCVVKNELYEQGLIVEETKYLIDQYRVYRVSRAQKS